jgi:hypothetical protein
LFFRVERVAQVAAEQVDDSSAAATARPGKNGGHGASANWLRPLLSICTNWLWDTARRAQEAGRQEVRGSISSRTIAVAQVPSPTPDRALAAPSARGDTHQKGDVIGDGRPAARVPAASSAVRVRRWASLGIRTVFRPAHEAARLSSRLAQLVAGFGTLVAEPRVRVIGGLFVAQTTMRWPLNVSVMSTAVTLLGTGVAGAGVLFSAIGLGGLLGAVLSLKLAYA